MQSPPIISDPAQIRRQKIRASAQFAEHDFLLRTSAERMAERLEVMARPFTHTLDLGAHGHLLKEYLPVKIAQSPIHLLHPADTPPHFVVADMDKLPFAPLHFDAVFSNLALHIINDLPGTLLQIRHILKQDGLFLATLFGGQTLKELRAVLDQATLEITGGATAYIAPFLDVRDAGALLQRAGFALPVVDSELLTISYPDLFSLLYELRGMGEGNASQFRKKTFSRREIFLRAAQLYSEQYADAEERLPATVELFTLTAWSPHAAQQQPAERGSAKLSLHSVFGNEKITP